MAAYDANQPVNPAGTGNTSQNIFQVPSMDQESAPVPPVSAQVPVESPGVVPPPVSVEPAAGSAVKPSGGGLTKILIIVFVVLLLGGLVFLGMKFLPGILEQSGVVPAKQVTLSWWGLWEDESIVTSLIAEYQQKNPSVKVNYVKQSQQDYRERLTNSLAKGTGPDIFRFHNSWVPMFKNELDTVPADVVSSADFQKLYYPVAVSDLSVGTGFVGIPLGYDGIALFINEEIFKTYGKTPPKSWDELRATALELTIKDEKGLIAQSGAALGRTENVDHWPEILALMMMQNGVRMNSPTGKPAEDALSYFTLFSSVDRVWDETLPPSTIAFSSGKVAMYFGPSWRVFEIEQQNPNLEYSVLPVPQLPKDDPSEPDVNYATYWVEGVWKRSENKKEAWDFLKFISSKESMQKLYANASKTRLFGEPYPRTDMASLAGSDAIVSVYLAQAPTAKSWYLHSRTYDGPTGINSQIRKYFEDAVNGVNNGKSAKSALETVAQGVNQVLSNYGLGTPTQP